METHETIADIIAEKRRRAADIRRNLSTVPIRRDEQLAEAECLENEADRMEAALKREFSEKESVIQAVESARTSEVSKLKDEIDELKKQVGNMAKLRKALKQVNKLNDLWFDTFALPDGATSIHDEIENVISDALSAPARNCDRPECATTKAAQEVWRREDGGKTAYYEWLLATATKGATDAD